MERIQKGYVLFPCFKVEYDTMTGETKLVCNDVLAKIFELFLVPFWTGKVYLRREQPKEKVPPRFD